MQCAAPLPAPHAVAPGAPRRADSLLAELKLLSTLPRSADGLDAHLHELTHAAARMLGASECVIVLLAEDSPTPVGAADVPSLAAIHESSIFKRVVLAHTPAATPSAGSAHGVLCAPIHGSGRMIGVIQVSGAGDRPCFDPEDRCLLEIATLYIGKSLEAMQLYNILQSRFAQIALAQDAAATPANLLDNIPDPRRLVKILARSFYQEMKKAGFGANEIIAAASEIIGELSGNLKRHARRRSAVAHPKRSPAPPIRREGRPED